MTAKRHFKAGDKVRSKSSGHAGLVTERIVIEEGHEIEPRLFAGSPHETPGKFEQRVDLRVEYTDDAGNKAEVLVHETDAEAA